MVSHVLSLFMGDLLTPKPGLPYEVSNPNLGPSYSWTPAGRGEPCGWLVDVRETKWNQVWDQLKPVFCLLQINRKPRVFDYLTLSNPLPWKMAACNIIQEPRVSWYGDVKLPEDSTSYMEKKHKWYHHCIFIVYHYIMIKHDIAMQTEQFFDPTNILGTVAEPGMAITPPLSMGNPWVIHG